jgi:TetR/AcrR family transcriptional repressor of nem operon
MNTEHHDVRQHLLKTGNSIIIGKGFAAVGLNEILTAAGVPKGSFYHYFKSKELFGVAMLEDYVADYLLSMDAVLRVPGRTAADSLIAYWLGWIDAQADSCKDCRCLVVKLGSEVSDMSEPMRLALLRGTDQIVARLATCIEQALLDGSLSAIAQPHHTALVLYQMWLGAAMLTKLRRDPSALDAALQATRAMLRLPPASGDRTTPPARPKG